MKILYLFAVFAIFNCSIKAQESYEPQKNFVSISYGFGNYVQFQFKHCNHEDNYNSKSLGPIFGKYEYSVTSHLGLGVAFAYASAHMGYSFDFGAYDSNYNLIICNYTYDWLSYSILLRVNWHFNSKNKKIDPYLGVGLGRRFVKYRKLIDPKDYCDLCERYEPVSLNIFMFKTGIELTGGMRYMVTNHIGIYTEIGLAKAIGQIGIVTKF